MTTTSYQRSAAMIAILWLLIAFVALTLFDRSGKPFSDEQHHFQTVLSFAESITLDKIKHYDEMPPPLSFVVYGLWARLVDESLWHIRLLSILLALSTMLILHRLTYELTGSLKFAVGVTLLFMLNPYTIGLGVLIYSDMLAILLLLIACRSALRSQTMVTLMAMVAALLTRQYTVFLWVALVSYYSIRWFRWRYRRDIIGAMMTVLSLFPLLGLFWFWGGTCPDNSIGHLYLPDNFAFHPQALLLYLAQVLLYPLPLVLARWRRLKVRRIHLAAALPPALLTITFPIAVAPSSQSVEVLTVGLGHRALQWLELGGIVESTLFFLAVWCGTVVLLSLIDDLYRRLRSGKNDPSVLLDMAILTFLAIMPWAYLWWEKYFMLLLPLLLMRLVLTKETVGATGVEGS